MKNIFNKEKLNNFFLFNPASNIKKIWDLFNGIILMSLISILPFYLSFYKEIPNKIYFLNFMAKICGGVKTLDIFVSLNTGFYFKGELKMNRKSILKNYMKSSFILDLISTIIPTIYFFSFNSPNNYFQILFVLRIIDIDKYIKIIEESLRENTKIIFELIKLFILIIYFAHLSGCLRHLISMILIERGHYNTWLVMHNIESEDFFVKYVNSLYFSIQTMITSGNITSNCTIEKLFDSFHIIFLAGIFVYAINQIGLIISEFKKKEQDLKFVKYKL